MEYKSFFSMLGMRFIRGFVSGAVSSMVMVNMVGVNTFEDMKIFFMSLCYSMIIGGISGAILAMDKGIRAQPDVDFKK